MKKILLFILVVFIFRVSVVYGFDITPYIKTTDNKQYVDAVTYIKYTSESVKIAWDPNPEPDIKGYELSVYSVERKIIVLHGFLPGRDHTYYNYDLPFQGHFVFYVRAVDLADQKSEWTCSLDATNSMVNGKHRSWWAYGYVAPPDDITIN